MALLTINNNIITVRQLPLFGSGQRSAQEATIGVTAKIQKGQYPGKHEYRIGDIAGRAQ